MNKDYGEIEISEGFVVGNYYECSRKYDEEFYPSTLKYLGEKGNERKFLDEDEIEVIVFAGSSMKSYYHEFLGEYVLHSNKNVLTWKITDIDYKRSMLTLELSKDGRKVSTTVGLDYSIKKLAESLGVNLWMFMIVIWF